MRQDDYKPFPEIELRSLAEHFDTCASWWEGGEFPANVDLNRGRADMLRNAIKCHEAVRARALEAETHYKVLSDTVAKYAAYGDAA